MERPSKGRAVITDTVGGIEIVIPAKRNWFIIIFMCAWLGGWFFGETTALASLSSGSGNLFLLFWVIGWTVGGIFAVRAVIWLLAGREIITIQHGQLTVAKRGALFVRDKVYDTDEIERIRVQEESELGGWNNSRRSDFLNMSSGGTIRFDYGLQTVKIASGIDEAEGYHVLQRIRQGQLLPERSFALLPPAISSLP
jgi:hypothetical protein